MFEESRILPCTGLNPGHVAKRPLKGVRVESHYPRPWPGLTVIIARWAASGSGDQRVLRVGYTEQGLSGDVRRLLIVAGADGAGRRTPSSSRVGNMQTMHRRPSECDTGARKGRWWP